MPELRAITARVQDAMERAVQLAWPLVGLGILAASLVADPSDTARRAFQVLLCLFAHMAIRGAIAHAHIFKPSSYGIVLMIRVCDSAAIPILAYTASVSLHADSRLALATAVAGSFIATAIRAVELAKDANANAKVGERALLALALLHTVSPLVPPWPALPVALLLGLAALGLDFHTSTVFFGWKRAALACVALAGAFHLRDGLQVAVVVMYAVNQVFLAARLVHARTRDRHTLDFSLGSSEVVLFFALVVALGCVDSQHAQLAAWLLAVTECASELFLGITEDLLAPAATMASRFTQALQTGI